MPIQQDPELVTAEAVTVAVVREKVAIADLTGFYDRAFGAALGAAARQGVAVTGPPVGVYVGMPTDTVDVAAGFPTAGPIADADGVTSMTLPGGTHAVAVHVGSYDTLGETYGVLTAWLDEQGLAPGPLMWETYETEPGVTPPDEMRTRIVWPIS